MSTLHRIRSWFGAHPWLNRLMGRPDAEPHTDNPRARESAQPRPPLDEDVRPPVERHTHD